MATNNQVGAFATAAASSRLSWWYRTRETRSAYMYLAPAAIIMTVITAFPLLFQVYMSFTDYGLKNLRYNSPAPNWVGLQNYNTVLFDPQNTISSSLTNYNFFGTLIFDLWWAFSNCAFHLVLGVLIAVLLNINGLWFKHIYRAVYILPVVIPNLIVATVWKNIFDTTDGPINGVLRGVFGLFGVPGATFNIPWLDNAGSDINPLGLPLAYYALLIANIWLGWPLFSVVATGALQSIPRELYEAAVVDGASSRQQFLSITAPLLRPSMLPYTIYGFIITFNLFNLSYFMSGGGPFGRTELLVTDVYKLVNVGHLYGIAAAFAIYMFFILLILTLVTNRLAKLTASND